MGMLLSEHLEYFREYGKVAYSTRKAIKFKKVWDLMITFSPILWIFLFLMVTVLANFL